MLLIKPIPFMRYRHLATAISATLVLVAVIALAVTGLDYGLDFTGGTQVDVHFAQPPQLDRIRDQLTGAGYPNHEVVSIGTDLDVTIRIQDAGDTQTSGQDSGQTAAAILEVLRSGNNVEVDLKGSAFVGSQVGGEMKEQAGLGMLVALAMIMIYITLRFQFKFAVGAVISLAHDTLLTLGFFALTRMNFDLTVVAAVLAVIGYSINDTIVVADRIRENFRFLRGYEPAEIIDISITQTLARSFLTSFTTLMVLVALYFFGGEIVRGFSLALMVGVFFGTTSSIYVAANTLMYLHISKEDLMQPIKDKEELDALP